jgi:hypothetical protein
LPRARTAFRRGEFFAEKDAFTPFCTCYVLFFPLASETLDADERCKAGAPRKRRGAKAIVIDGKPLKEGRMNAAGQIAVTLAVLIGFGRIFLADEGMERWMEEAATPISIRKPGTNSPW